MANEAIYAYGTTKTLEASGASAANNTVVAANDAGYDLVTDGAGFPDAEFVAALTFATAPTINTVVALYAQELSIDGANNAVAPTTTFTRKFIGSFVLNSQTGAQYIKIAAYDVPKNANYWLHNNATGQTLSAGWTLKVTPRTIKPAV